MAILTKEPRKQVIDLTGPQGNAFYLLGLAKKLCKKYKYTVLDQTSRSFVFEVSALKKEIDDLIKKLQPLGLASASRTGVVAMTKGSEIYKQN